MEKISKKDVVFTCEPSVAIFDIECWMIDGYKKFPQKINQKNYMEMNSKLWIQYHFEMKTGYQYEFIITTFIGGGEEVTSSQCTVELSGRRLFDLGCL